LLEARPELGTFSTGHFYFNDTFPHNALLLLLSILSLVRVLLFSFQKQMFGDAD
jgi:hypothetical protein